MKNSKGFSLIELAIAITIIGFLIGAVLKGQSLIEDAKVQDGVKTATDLSEVSLSFKNRYHYIPGDLPLAGNDIAGLSTGCNLPINTSGIGDGAINNATERSCANEELLLAGYIKSAISSPFGSGATWLTSFTDASTSGNTPCTNGAVSNTTPTPRAVNVVLMDEVPIKLAQQMDIKTDDGIFNTGQVRASADYTSTTVSLVCIAIPL